MTTDNLLPLGQKPEGELNSLLRMQNAFNKLMSSWKLLEENINKLKEENKRLCFKCLYNIHYRTLSTHIWYGS